jgi:AcrR family transcriptional regulator
MDAALALVAEGGLPALSLREAARRAGVSPAAPYHHFPSREALVAALAMEGFEGMRLAMERELATAGEDPIDRLLASGRGYVTYAIASPASFQIMFGAGRLCDLSQFPEVVAASEPVGAILMESVATVSQLPGMPEVDLAKLGLFAWSSVHGASWLVLDGALKPEMTSGVALQDALANVETFGVMLRALTSRAGAGRGRGEDTKDTRRRQSVK